MAYCTDCGAPVRDGASFCAECGSEIEPATHQRDPAVTRTPGGEAERNEQDGDADRVLASLALAVLPAFGGYVLGAIAFSANYTAVFVLLYIGFVYVLYQRPSPKAIVGGASFWIAIEAFLSPIAFLFYTAGLMAGLRSNAELAGAALSGFLLVALAFLVGVPLGIVLYLVSRRLDVDGGAG